MENQRNFLMAAALSMAVVFGWQFFVVQPRVERERAIAEQQAIELAKNSPKVAEKKATTEAGVPAAVTPAASSSATPGAAPIAVASENEIGRVELETDKLIGSINLRGARIDDLRLAAYRETVDKSSPNIRLLAPAKDQKGYYGEFGFSPNPALGDLPGPSTVWTLVEGRKLTAQTPVTLKFSNKKGLTFSRKISIDENYMFSIEDSVDNQSGAAVSLQSYGRIARYGEPQTQGIYVLHEGMVGAVGDQGLDEIDYDEVQEDGLIQREPANAGWMGITDKYWATALIPGTRFTTAYRYIKGARPFYQVEYISDPLAVAAGGQASITNQFFSGAKKSEIIDGYKDSLNIPLFDKIIDWGWFYWITKPLFSVLNYFYELIGNFGVAILIVTVLLKILFFPLANKSYKSMANMKKMQPEMTAIRERFGDDKQGQQKAMMDLYKKEKINPAAGCWPMLIQIPVFFALYKVIYVTIEMRQAPFFGWITDLSVADPTSLFNLFGLLPFSVPAYLAIGVWPLLMGITMFIQMQMNPAPPDPTQQMIFKWMPIVFTFMLATFPAGLVIYWAWNNTLTILQQGTIMRRQGVKIELWDNLKGLIGRASSSS